MCIAILYRNEMYTFLKCMGPYEQHILIELLEKKRVYFHTQNYYGSRRAFNKAMGYLKVAGWIESRIIKINGRFVNEYFLTNEGLIFSNMLECYYEQFKRRARK